MNNRFKKIAAVVALLLLPIGAFADLGLPDFFTETRSGDISINILTQIFGHVPGVLYGTNFQLISRLIEIFNAGLVSVMGVIFCYTTLKVTLHACHEGEMMAGKGKSLGMAVMRSVGGLSLCIPASSGYCAIQILVIWLAVQGIGFANMAWSGVVKYLINEGGMYESHESDAQDAPYMVDIGHQFSTLLQSEACVYKLQSLYKAQKDKETQTNTALAASDSGDFAAPSTTSYPAPSTVFGFARNLGDPQGSYHFGTKNTQAPTAYEGVKNYEAYSYNAECGVVNMKSLYGSNMGAIDSLVAFMEPAARRLAAYDPAKPDASLIDYLAGTIAIATTNYTQMIAPARKKAGQTKRVENEAYLMSSLQQGWLVAGAYYPLISKLGAMERESLKSFIPDMKPNGFDDGGNFNYPMPADTRGPSYYKVEEMSSADKIALANTLRMLNSNNQPDYDRVINGYILYLNSFAQSGQTNMQYVESASKNSMNGMYQTGFVPENESKITISGITNRSEANKGRDNVSAIGWSGGPAGGALMTIWAAKMHNIAQDFIKAIDPKAVDPILSIQKFGISLQAAAVSYFLASFFSVFGTTLAAAIIPSTTVSTAIKASSELPSLLISLWVGMCFTLGGALGYYLVLILFITFFTAVVSWVAQVFQAVPGSALVALRLIDPDGEGMMGKSGEGFTMIFSLCLTPFLLIIGFVVAMVLTKQALILLNYTFSIFMFHSLDVWKVNNETWLIVGMPMVILIYTTLVVSLAQLIATMCLTEGMTTVKGFFTASAMGQRIGGDLNQDTKGAASGQASGHGQAVGGGVAGANKGVSISGSELKADKELFKSASKKSGQDAH